MNIRFILFCPKTASFKDRDHLRLHIRKRNIQNIAPCDKDYVCSRTNGGKHRRDTGTKSSFGAVSLHTVPHLFGNRKADFDVISAILCPNQRKQT